MSSVDGIIGVLSDAGIEFIVIGALVAQANGMARLARDADFVYRRTPDNVERLCATLSPLEPYLQGAPPGLPFRFDSETVWCELNFNLTTKLGDLNLLGEMPGGGAYEQALPYTIERTIFERRVRVLDVPALIRAKRAAGRPRDLEAIAELEALLVEQERLERS